jgi:hypothetical protein
MTALLHWRKIDQIAQYSLNENWLTMPGRAGPRYPTFCAILLVRYKMIAIMHLTDSARYVIVMVKEIDHDTRRIKQPDLS